MGYPLPPPPAKSLRSHSKGVNHRCNPQRSHFKDFTSIDLIINELCFESPAPGWPLPLRPAQFPASIPYFNYRERREMIGQSSGMRSRRSLKDLGLGLAAVGLTLDHGARVRAYTGVMIPPTGERPGSFLGCFRLMASAIISTYLRPAPVLKMTTRSDGLRKPVESRWS